MKTKLVFLLLVSFTSIIALQAQKLGLRAGVNLNSSNISFNDMDAKLRTGFNAGVISDFSLPLLGWKINSGLLFAYQGFSLRQELGTNKGVTYHFDTNNLQIPVNLRKEFSVLPVKPFLQGGIYASYILSGKIKDGSDSRSMEFNKSRDRLDIGLNLGVGASVISKLRLVANYSLGFNENKIIFGDQTVSYKNTCWSLSAEYMF